MLLLYGHEPREPEPARTKQPDSKGRNTIILALGAIRVQELNVGRNLVGILVTIKARSGTVFLQYIRPDIEITIGTKDDHEPHQFHRLAVVRRCVFLVKVHHCFTHDCKPTTCAAVL
ncbi:hypothetical protein PsorP6_016913 [Peronosclerospora sorghi]|uniref:Uncharacterized protein n=1 Tax=Peronosclerospora sorghi TaxID=230839 RepID=A0ACC0WD78_9STRA|nr:hypothetical protein PsorP6_016913 [Peronosclerospora sorghi]